MASLWAHLVTKQAMFQRGWGSANDFLTSLLLVIVLCVWASCRKRKIVDCACAGNAGNIFPTTAGWRSLHASRHVRDASGVMQTGVANQRFPFEVCGRENIPGNPSACATRYFTYLVRGPLHIHHFNSIISHKGDIHVRIYQTSNVNRSSSTHYNTFNVISDHYNIHFQGELRITL